MDGIAKALVFDGLVKVVAFKTTDLVNEAIGLHGLSPLAAEALGKVLSVAAYMSNELKGDKEKLSVQVTNKGALGSIIVAADAGAKVRGYVEHKDATLPPLGNGKQDLFKGIGSEGFITVIKDLGLKDPYVGRTELVRGNLEEDFAWYFTRSEGAPTALALEVMIGEDGACSSAGGVLVQPMPGCPEHILVIVEDIVSQFAHIGEIYKEKDASDVLKDFFGHFKIEYFPVVKPVYRCKCSREQMSNAVISLGRADSVNLLMERGEIEVLCHFCGRKYVFTKQDVIDIWRKYDHKV